jgi:hypothetical protein
MKNPRPLRIFLCHSSGDKQVIRELFRRLRDDGFDPWLDEENLLPGQNWEQVIASVVRAVDVVTVCLSRESINKKGFVQKEIKFALDVADEQPDGTIFLIPIKLEECDLPERLRHLHAVSLFQERGYERLKSALEERVRSLADVVTGKPLAAGLLPKVRITGGHFGYASSKPASPLLGDFIFTVTGGSIQRREDGKLIATITTRSPLASAQKLNERLGTDKMQLVSDDTEASTDPAKPTTFISSSTFRIPAGEGVLGHTFPKTVTCRVDTTVKGYLTELVFKGTFNAAMFFDGQRMDVSGTFEVDVV